MRITTPEIEIEIGISNTKVKGERVRLMVDYPRTPYYRDLVMDALADLLKPAAAGEQKHADGTTAAWSCV